MTDVHFMLLGAREYTLLRPNHAKYDPDYGTDTVDIDILQGFIDALQGQNVTVLAGTGASMRRQLADKALLLLPGEVRAEIVAVETILSRPSGDPMVWKPASEYYLHPVTSKAAGAIQFAVAEDPTRIWNQASVVALPYD